MNIYRYIRTRRKINKLPQSFQLSFLRFFSLLISCTRDSYELFISLKKSPSIDISNNFYGRHTTLFSFYIFLLLAAGISGTKVAGFIRQFSLMQNTTTQKKKQNKHRLKKMLHTDIKYAKYSNFRFSSELEF